MTPKEFRTNNFELSEPWLICENPSCQKFNEMEFKKAIGRIKPLKNKVDPAGQFSFVIKDKCLWLTMNFEAPG
jgi:hypothetical protein